MSQSKHKFYRKVLNVSRSMVQIGGLSVEATRVIWCAVEGTTSRTVKTSHVAMSIYIGSKAHSVDMISFKPCSIKIKNPMSSAVLVDWTNSRMDRDVRDATATAAMRFVLQTPSMSQNVTGVVTAWFSCGTQGLIKTALGEFTVYACNIAGAKTWYPETACMFLKEGETVTFDLADMGAHLTPSKVRGNVYFDEAKWASLDQSKLAFKCDEKGNAINGLF